MSERGEAQGKEDAFASGAKPRPEGPVRERGRRPTRCDRNFATHIMEAACPRAIAGGRQLNVPRYATDAEAAP